MFIRISEYRKTICIVSILMQMLIFYPVVICASDQRPLALPLAQNLRKLDQNKIHALYNDGDFDKVIAAIDSFTVANKSFDHNDSVFIAKHLAVVYTANPETREMGKNYMFRLLELVPSAKIVDMFVSDEIDHIFEKVKEEYSVRKSSQMDVPAKKTSKTFYWVTGGVALAAISVGTVYLLWPKPAADKVYELPSK